MNYLKIKKNTDFQKLFKRGKRVFSPNLTLIYFPSDKPMMGVAVSKKHGKAVQRNRVKRLLREAFRKTVNEAKRSYAYIIVPKPAENYSFEGFEKSLKNCFKKVNSCPEKNS